jgi:hypothetical protein
MAHRFLSRVRKVMRHQSIADCRCDRSTLLKQLKRGKAARLQEGQRIGNATTEKTLWQPSEPRIEGR